MAAGTSAVGNDTNEGDDMLLLCALPTCGNTCEGDTTDKLLVLLCDSTIESLLRGERSIGGRLEGDTA